MQISSEPRAQKSQAIHDNDSYWCDINVLEVPLEQGGPINHSGTNSWQELLMVQVLALTLTSVPDLHLPNFLSLRLKQRGTYFLWAHSIWWKQADELLLDLTILSRMILPDLLLLEISWFDFLSYLERKFHCCKKKKKTSLSMIFVILIKTNYLKFIYSDSACFYIKHTE